MIALQYLLFASLLSFQFSHTFDIPFDVVDTLTLFYFLLSQILGLHFFEEIRRLH